MKVLHQLQNLLITACLGLLLFCSAGRVDACVEGLAWGMPFEQVTAHLGEVQAVNEQQSGRYVTRDVLLDRDLHTRLILSSADITSCTLIEALSLTSSS